MITTQALAVVPALQGLPHAELEWLAGELQLRELAAGEQYYAQGEPAGGLYFVLAGSLQVLRREAGREANSGLIEAGEIAGRLPFSRMHLQGVTALALRETRVAELATAQFGRLQAHAPGVLQLLVHEMLDRTQEYTRMGAQREKLVSLGTMSAGLAHEINNPASAARRAAQTLQATLQAFDVQSSRILSPVLFRDGADEGGTGEADPFAPLYAAMTLDGDGLSPLLRAEREEELGGWLAAQGVAQPWDVAATLVGGGLNLAVMAGVAQALVPGQLLNFLEWVPRDVELRLLARDLMESTRRISDLVGAMKAYSYMDQGQGRQDVDIHEGLSSTLVILKHRWSKKSVQIVRAFGELPRVRAYGSELNQVWTNLLSNAIDAVGEGGTVTLRTRHDPHAGVVCVDIEDDGPGVPPELHSRIFEPFFTTKGVGEGTGMGLDIANRIVRQRHLGTLQLVSEPGHTSFQVRLPVSPDAPPT